MQESHQVATGLPASRDCRPDRLTPPATLFAARPLRDFSIEHNESNRLFGQIVGRVDARCRNELKERVAVVAEPLRHVSCFSGIGHPPGRLSAQFVSRRGQAAINRSLGKLVAAMERTEQFANRIQQSLAVRLGRFVRKGRQAFALARSERPARRGRNGGSSSTNSGTRSSDTQPASSDAGRAIVPSPPPLERGRSGLSGNGYLTCKKRFGQDRNYAVAVSVDASDCF